MNKLNSAMTGAGFLSVSSRSKNGDGSHRHLNLIEERFIGTIHFYGYGLIHDQDGESIWISSNEFDSHTPEPESYAMFLTGLGLMGFIARRPKNGLL